MIESQLPSQTASVYASTGPTVGRLERDRTIEAWASSRAFVNSSNVSAAANGAVHSTTKPPKHGGYAEFRRRVDALGQTVQLLVDLTPGQFESEWAGFAAQVDADLEELRRVEWAERKDPEALERIVVVVNGIVRNAEWTPEHGRYLQAVIQELQTCYFVDSALAVKMSRLAGDFGLDRFRGSVSDAEPVKHYKIVECER